MFTEVHKVCFKCRETKPLSAFYKHSKMADGHVNKCKECNKVDVKENTERRSDYYKAYDRLRSNLPHRAAGNSAHSKREDVKERRRTCAKNTTATALKRKSAAVAVNNAVRDGKMFKLPCIVCGEIEVQGHHPDYDKVYDVIWLCTKHHGEVHRDFDHAADALLLESTKKGSRYDQAILPH